MVRPTAPPAYNGPDECQERSIGDYAANGLLMMGSGRGCFRCPLETRAACLAAITLPCASTCLLTCCCSRAVSAACLQYYIKRPGKTLC